MTLRVSNTLTGEREEFEPRDPDSVLLYVCGLTVSDAPHLGHARTWVHADVMHRWLSHLGYDVRHVENFTDVNEKIAARVGENDLGDTEAEVARHFTRRTIADMRSLNLLRAAVYPRVSEHVPEIIDLIETLVEEGYAYESNGSVYFDVTTFPDYGTLSNQDVEELESQGAEAERAEKRHPADFALWKAGAVAPENIDEHRPSDLSPVEEPTDRFTETWESPWGEGRPGWHIECSAMSMAHLDETIDIHVGGQDLVFPHHENEIAQSEAATGQQFARYWLHVRLLETDGEKMSSSLGNFFTVREAVSAVGTDVVRMFLLSTAYSQRQSYTEAALHEARQRWERLEAGYQRATDACDSTDAHTKVADEELREAVASARTDAKAAMNDDFNTREAIAALFDLVSAVNRHADANEKGTDTNGSGANEDNADSDKGGASEGGVNEDAAATTDGYDYRGLRRAIETFEEFGEDVLGFTFGAGDEPSGDVRLAEELVELLLDVREAEREAGNYERADRLREDLHALGVEVQDADDGPTYRLS